MNTKKLKQKSMAALLGYGTDNNINNINDIVSSAYIASSKTILSGIVLKSITDSLYLGIDKSS
jgi:hypothetical protein